MLDQTQTNDEGKYAFNLLPTGEYQLQFDIPAGFRATKANQGGLQVNSDIDDAGLVAMVPVLLGLDNADADAGLIKTLEVGDRVWEDLNANGLQDVGEPGIEQIEVSALDASGNVLDQTLTDASGAYHFVNLPSIDLRLKFEIPAGYRSTQNIGGQADLNSDVDGTGSTALLMLAGQTNTQDIDAGFYRLACIGDFVWLDENENGIQDGNDAGLSDVMVILYDDQDNQVEIFVSNASGQYQFCDLEPGTYYLSANPRVGYFPTITGSGSSLLDAGGGLYRTPSFTLQSGDDIADLDLVLYTNPRPICVARYLKMTMQMACWVWENQV